MPRRRPEPLLIPAYTLYGEIGDLPDGVHAETIDARSSGLDWRISAHRHASLYQAVYIEAGGARASIEGLQSELQPGDLAWVPPLTVHAYAFAPQTVGIVVTIPVSILAAALGLEEDLRLQLEGPLIVRSAPSEAVAGLGSRCAALLAEFLTPGPGHGRAMTAHVTLLAIEVGRAGLGKTASHVDPHGDLMLARRFLEAVEASYRARRPLFAYAEALGVSVSHLCRTCRAVTGRAPLRLIHDRRLIEAKRDLVYTAMPIHRVADRLGFDSPAYFSRFFKQRTGLGPQAFRQASGTSSASDETTDTPSRLS